MLDALFVKVAEYSMLFCCRSPATLPKIEKREKVLEIGTHLFTLDLAGLDFSSSQGSLAEHLGISSYSGVAQGKQHDHKWRLT